MEKSIESIWKEGFINDGAMVAPKLNDLYNQKSQFIIDKMKRMMKINVRAIYVFSILVLLVTIPIGMPLVGLTVFVLFGVLGLYSQKHLGQIEEINKGASSYDYLVAFKRWREQVMTTYTKIYSFFYPVFFFAIVLGFCYSTPGQRLMTTIYELNPDITMVYGIPLIGWGLLIVNCLLFSVFAGAIYRLDIKIVYGRVFKRLDEMLADMEELRRQG